jgi:hypothetical protein
MLGRGYDNTVVTTRKSDLRGAWVIGCKSGASHHPLCL